MGSQLTYKDERGELKTDLIGVQSFLSDFSNIITTTNYKVYGLSGAWGTGKTTFITIWENTLPVTQYIHINAFENDYESNAFLVIFSAIYNYLQQTKKFNQDLEDLLNESKNFLINIAKATGKLGISIIAEKTGGKETWKNFMEDVLDSYFDDIIKKSTENKNYRVKLVSKLNSISCKLESPLYIIVDELDRCRPLFALEILEKIKHIFSVDNIKFILVYSEDIFAKVIEKEYGLKEGGLKYLNKFIYKKIYLEYPMNIENWFIKQLEDEFSNKSESDIYLDLKNLYFVLIKIKEENFISLRDFRKILSCANNYTYNEKIDYFVLLTIEFLRYINIKELKGMIEYVKANGSFAFNAPSRHTFDHIISLLLTNMRLGNRDSILDLAHKSFYQLCAQKTLF